MSARSRHHRALARPGCDPDSAVISVTSARAYIDAATDAGFSREDLLARYGLTEAQLRARLGRISWRQVLAGVDYAESAGATIAELEDLGARMTRSQHLRLSQIAGFFVKSETLLFVSLGWFGPALFPVIGVDLRQSGSLTELAMQLPEHFPGSAGYFHLCKGVIAHMPTIIGQPPAAVTGDITPRRARFTIHSAAHVAGASRLRRIARALRSADGVVAALLEQQRLLRRADVSLADSRRQFRAIFEALPDPALIVRERKILHVNEAFCSALNWPRATDLIGRTWTDQVHPDDRAAARDHDRARKQFRFLRCDGSTAVLEVSPRQPVDYDGAPASVLVARDITERLEVERHLAQADRISTLGTLAAGIAHEINNPLSLVLSNLELAERRGVSSPLVAAAREGARRVREIVKDLRIFSQPSQDTREAVDLREVIESTVRLARGQTHARANLAVSVEDLPPILGNRGRFGQAVLNLILNAAGALPAERGRDENTIAVRAHRTGDSAVIEVRDNGAGIDPAAQPHVFEPFFTTKGGGQSSGLGLAIAREIVEEAGGHIDFTTQPGRGTTFSVCLPLAAGRDADVEASSEIPAEAAESGEVAGRVLIVDDQELLADILCEFIADIGHSADAVYSGRQALEVLHGETSYDLVLCDLQMANGSGAELHAQLERTRPELARRIVFMTGGSFGAETRRFLASVDNRSLTKPFDLDELQQLINDLVADAQRARRAHA